MTVLVKIYHCKLALIPSFTATHTFPVREYSHSSSIDVNLRLAQLPRGGWRGAGMRHRSWGIDVDATTFEEGTFYIYYGWWLGRERRRDGVKRADSCSEIELQWEKMLSQIFYIILLSWEVLLVVVVDPTPPVLIYYSEHSLFNAETHPLLFMDMECELQLNI